MTEERREALLRQDMTERERLNRVKQRDAAIEQYNESRDKRVNALEAQFNAAEERLKINQKKLAALNDRLEREPMSFLATAGATGISPGARAREALEAEINRNRQEMRDIGGVRLAYEGNARKQGLQKIQDEYSDVKGETVDGIKSRLEDIREQVSLLGAAPPQRTAKDNTLASNEKQTAATDKPEEKKGKKNKKDIKQEENEAPESSDAMGTMSAILKEGDKRAQSKRDKKQTGEKSVGKGTEKTGKVKPNSSVSLPPMGDCPVIVRSEEMMPRAGESVPEAKIAKWRADLEKGRQFIEEHSAALQKEIDRVLKEKIEKEPSAAVQLNAEDQALVDERVRQINEYKRDLNRLEQFINSSSVSAAPPLGDTNVSSPSSAAASSLSPSYASQSVSTKKAPAEEDKQEYKPPQFNG